MNPAARLTHALDAEQRWIGPCLLGVAALHTAVGLLLFTPVLAELLRLGWWDSVGGHALRGAVVWFLLFGAPLALLATLVRPLQQVAQWRALRHLGWGLLALAAFGASLMPVSGFWLVLPPALALLRAPRW